MRAIHHHCPPFNWTSISRVWTPRMTLTETFCPAKDGSKSVSSWTKLRRRYQSAGAEHKRKLLDQAQELLGYHRKAAIRALRAPTEVRGPRIVTGRPVMYEPAMLQRWLRPIWAATDYACGRRLPGNSCFWRAAAPAPKPPEDLFSQGARVSFWVSQAHRAPAGSCG